MLRFARVGRLAAAVLAVMTLTSCAPPATTLVSEYDGRVTGGTLVIAPFHAEHRLQIPRLPGEEGADVDLRYTRFLRIALAREIQRQTRFDRVLIDEYVGTPDLEMRRLNQRRYNDQRLRVQQGHDFSIAAPAPGRSIATTSGTPEFVLFFGDVEIEAVRGRLLPGTIEMPHRIAFMLWNNETGEVVLFNQTREALTLYVEPLPEGTPLDEQMARSRYVDGLSEFVDGMFGTSQFHVSAR